LIIIFIPVNIFAHGVKGEISKGGIVITAKYDTDEPMSYAKVEVYAPDSKIKFQTGRTDRNGRFAFVPDIAGKWHLSVDDGIGHKLNMDVEINESLKKSSKELSKGDFFIFFKNIRVIIGILTIFIIFLLLKFLLKFEKRRKNLC